MSRLFGTDGVRGEANLELTPELAYRLGRAATLYFSEKSEDDKQPSIIIGRDTRISGTMFESALSAGITSAGGRAIVAGIVPTPAIAYFAKSMNMKAGIVVSASHNPYYDNGIKFFGGDGYEIESIVRHIEMHDDLYRPSCGNIGTVEFRHDLVKHYMEYVLSTTDVKLDGMKVVLDCANGAAYEVMPAILRRLGADLTVIHAAPYGTNINDNCGSTHLESLKEAVLEYKADLGIAHDGDADRCLCVDEKGDVIDGDHILVMCGLDRMKQGKLANNTIVTTVMANIGFHQAVKAAGGKVEVTKVGDRYVLENMLENGHCLGGEQSGHIIFSDFATTGDGLITALQVLSAVKRSGKKASVLNGMMTSYPQVLINVTVGTKEGWEENTAIAKAIDEGNQALGERGRILVRPSGTEPLIRVMAEGPDEDELNTICNKIADVVKSELGK